MASEGGEGGGNVPSSSLLYGNKMELSEYRLRDTDLGLYVYSEDKIKEFIRELMDSIVKMKPLLFDTDSFSNVQYQEGWTDCLYYVVELIEFKVGKRLLEV